MISVSVVLLDAPPWCVPDMAAGGYALLSSHLHTTPAQSENERFLLMND